jgi:hypothetical protein
MTEVTFMIRYNLDTDNLDEAVEDARQLQWMIREGWYGSDFTFGTLKVETNVDTD